MGVCTCCREYNFAYKNILLAFQEDEMLNFLHWLMENKFHPETYLPLPHDRERVYRSPLDNLFLAFSRHELEELEKMFAELQLVLEARKIVNKPR